MAPNPNATVEDTEEGRHGRDRWGEDARNDEIDDGPQASTPGSSLIHVDSDDEAVDRQHLPLPVWLRESSKSFYWGWVPVRIRQAARTVAKWAEGPNPPQIQKIHPWFPRVQRFLPTVIDTYFPQRRHKAALLGFFYFCWLLTFSLVLNKSAQAGQIKGYGQPQSIWCGGHLLGQRQWMRSEWQSMPAL